MQNFFFIRSDGRFIKISFGDLLWAEACKNYTKIVTLRKTYMALATLKKLEAILPAQGFCRIHRGFIISLDNLISFDKQTACLPGREFPIGYEYRNKLPERVMILDIDRAPSIVTGACLSGTFS